MGGNGSKGVANDVAFDRVSHTNRWDEERVLKQKVHITTSANLRTSRNADYGVPNINDIFAEFLKLDKRLKASKDYKITPAGPELFKYVSEAALSKSLFVALQAVQAIYHSQRGLEEVYSSQDQQKQNALLDLVLATKVMQRCLSALREAGLFVGSNEEFRQRLYEIWFHLWGRNNDTCAFEHVFVGERLGHIVDGLHNWIQYYRQQQKGNIKNYTPIPRNNKIARKDALIVTMSFDWLGKHKKIGSMFIGTTPAFEMAIYTYLFFSKQEEKSITPIRLGIHDIEIHLIKNGERIITTYPEVVD